MLKPKYIEQLPDNLIELYSQLEQDILADMARRISTYDYYIPTAEWQKRKLIELGNYEIDVKKALSARTGKTEEEIKQMMEEAGVETLRFDDSIYRAAGLKPPSLSASPAMLEIVKAGIRKTNGLFHNLTSTTAHTSAKQFEDAMDRAYMQVVSGAFSHETAIRTAVKDLARKGVNAITYPSGRTDSLETAVRRCVVTGVNQTALQLQSERADEMDCDLVETTAHGGARPSHAEWQGKIFSRSGKSRKYPDFVQSTRYGYGDGLGGWNCRHSFYPFFEGISHRAYTDADLKDYNAEKYEYNGHKMTEYEASQAQRGIERNIRRWKREEKAMQAAGLPMEEAKAKVCKWQAEQRNFINQTGLKRQYSREQIAGKGVVKSGKGGIIKENIIIGRSIGAAAKNYPVRLPSGNHAKFAEGTEISKIKVFAGKGTETPIRNAIFLENDYGIKAEEWRKVRGEGIIVENGKHRKAEIHWYEADDEKVKMKVKRWLDEG